MKKKRAVLLSLALPYMIAVFLPIVSVGFLGFMISDSYHEKIIIDRQQSIESAFDRFCQRMDNIEALSYLVAENSTILQYVYKSLRGEERSVIDNIEVSEALSYFLVNSDVETMYLYDPRDERVITPQNTYSQITDFFEYGYQTEGDFPVKDEGKVLVWGYGFNPAHKVKLDLKEKEVVEFRMPLPIGRFKNEQSQLVIVMEVKEILGDLFDVLESAEFYLYDNRNQLIYSNGNQYEMLIEDDKEMELKRLSHKEELYGMVCYSPDSSWRLQVFIPDMIKNGVVDQRTQYAWILMGVSLFGCIVFCAFFTFRNYKDIQDILKSLQSRKTVEDDEKNYKRFHGYGMIKEYTDNLIVENNNIKKDLFELEKSRKYEILDKMIRNTYQNNEEAIEKIDKGVIASFEGSCVVLCIRYRGASYRTFVSENLMVKDYMKIRFSEIIKENFEIFDISSRETICVLFIQDRELNECVDDIISQINVDVVYQYSIDVDISVGNVVDSVYQIRESYQQAKAVLRYRESSGKNVHFYSELVQLEDVYYYPEEYEEKIYNYMVAGKNAEAKEILQKIYRENFEDNENILTANAAKLIKNRIMDFLNILAAKYDVAEDSEFKDKLEELKSAQSNILFFQDVYIIVDVISEKVMMKKKDVQKNTTLKIMQYINNNYCDNMLSLKQISHALGLSESYISNLFRCEYGEPISVVIENRRIDKACTMIKNSDMKIGDIALAVGYSSDVSFRRAFKKIVGVSPGEYRDKTEV